MKDALALLVIFHNTNQLNPRMADTVGSKGLIIVPNSDDASSNLTHVRSYMITKKKIMNLSTTKSPCQNGFNISQCLTNYIQNNTGCRYPWSTNLLHLKNCSNEQDIKKYYSIANQFQSNSPVKMLQQADCKIPCEYYKYDAHMNYAYNDIDENGRNYILQLYMSYDDVQVEEQYRLYKLGDLTADIGGYLGLLLGISLLSCYDFIASFLAKFTHSDQKKAPPKNRKKIFTTFSLH